LSPFGEGNDPHDTIVFFVSQEGVLIRSMFTDWDYDQFTSLRIPLGQVFPVGSLATRSRSPTAIRRRNFSSRPVLAKYHAPVCTQPFRSAARRVAGVLNSYHREKKRLLQDHLRLLLAASSKLGPFSRNAPQYEQAQSTASTDYLQACQRSLNL